MTGQDEEPPRDRFGLPKMSVNAEVAISFTLFIMGGLLVFSSIYAARNVVDMGPGLLGLLLITAAYLFSIEAIRELEQKDHFLSRKLMEE